MPGAEILDPASPIAAGRVGIGAQAAYGTGQIAGQVFRDLPSLLLLFFMTNTLGVSPALAGLTIFVPKLVWGILCDVAVGIASDRLRRRLARRWWLLFGAAGAPVCMMLLFHVPVLGMAGRAAYVAAAFSLYMMVFAVFSVPYLAIAGDLSSEPQQRTVLMAWRLVFTSVGVLVAASLAPIYLQYMGGGQRAYEAMARVLAVICPLALVVAFFGAGRATRAANYQAREAASRGFPVREALAALAAPGFSVLLCANLFQLIGAGMAYASMLYFLTYNLHRSDAFAQIGLISLIACGAIIAAQPGWVFIARHCGKKTTYVGASLFYGLTMLFWGLTAHVGIGASYVFAVLLGLSNSGWSLMGFSMVSDLFGDGRAGLYSAVWIAADKIGFALGGTLLTGLLLSLFGFDAARAVSGAPQPASALTGVLIAYAVAPAFLSCVAALLFARRGRTADTSEQKFFGSFFQKRTNLP